MNNCSMLAYLGPKLHHKVEDLATDALLYLLRTYPDISASFFDLLKNIGCRLPLPLHFDTQLSLKNKAIPDLLGKTENDELALLVEVKFGAPFTPNQPLAYLEQLTVNPGGAVIILAPASRFEYLWPETKEICVERGLSLSNLESDPPRWETTLLDDDVVIGFLSWGFLLDNLTSISDDLALQELYQLSGLVKRLEEELFQPFQVEELITTSDRSRERFIAIVEELAINLAKTDIFTTEGYSVGRGAGFYKRYGTFMSRNNWCVEYNEHNASKHGYSFVWLSGPLDKELIERVNKLESDESMIAIRDENSFLIPLMIPLDSERPSILRNLLDQIERIATTIGSSTF